MSNVGRHDNVLGALMLMGLLHLSLGASISTQKRVPSTGLSITPVSSPVSLGEGPHWDEQEGALYFVDIMGHRINRLHPESGKQTVAVLDGTSVDLIIPVFGKPKTFLVAVDRKITEVSWDGDNLEGNLVGKTLVTVDSDKPDNRFNDGKADPKGRLWAGTMGPEPVVGQVMPKQGSLFTFKASVNGIVSAVTHLREVDISNGLVWTSDNSTMYYIDTGKRTVDGFDFNIEEGEISRRRVAFDFEINNITGVPDGMTIDSDGNIWIACFQGSQVIKVDPREGALLGSIPLPAERVTSVAFGGPKFEILYITTSRFGLTDEELAKQPDAGCVFAVTGLGVQGLPGQRANPLDEEENAE